MPARGVAPPRRIVLPVAAVCRSAALLSLVLVVACSVAGAAGATSGRSGHACLKGKELRFRAADRTQLAAHRFGSGATAIVFVHGNGSNLCEWVPHARRLAARGFFVLAFDFRGHGLSQRRSYPISERFAGDVAAAVKLVRRLGKREVHLIGSSLGASASLVAAVNVVPPVASVVSLSAPASFRRQQPLALAPRLRVPVLYVASDDEQLPLDDDARAMYAATAATDKRLEIVPGRSHGVRILASPAVQALVEEFVREH
jgi:pimeloyl-ACP methyl ester carboxylesterase